MSTTTLRNALGAMTVAAVLLTAGTAFAQTTGTYDPATNTYTVNTTTSSGTTGTTGTVTGASTGVTSASGTTGTTGSTSSMGSTTGTGTTGTPGTPNTGAGGDAATTLLILSTSGVIAALGGAYLLRQSAFSR